MREESPSEASAAEIKMQREADSSFFPVWQSINNNSILRSLFTAAIRTLMQTGKIAAELKKLDRASLRLLFLLLLFVCIFVFI